MVKPLLRMAADARKKKFFVTRGSRGGTGRKYGSQNEANAGIPDKGDPLMGAPGSAGIDQHQQGGTRDFRLGRLFARDRLPSPTHRHL